MTDEKKKVDVKETADSIIRETKAKSNNSQFVLWFAALILGAVLGWMGIPALNEFFNFVATVFTRLFQFIAVFNIHSAAEPAEFFRIYFAVFYRYIITFAYGFNAVYFRVFNNKIFVIPHCSTAGFRH